MSSPSRPKIDGAHALMTAAAVVIVIAGLKAIGPILVPMLVAGFLAMLSFAPILSLRRRGVPDWLAIFVVFGAVLISVLVTSIVVGASIADFQAHIPQYQERLSQLTNSLLLWLDAHEWMSLERLRESFDTGVVLRMIGGWLGALGKFMSNTVLVLLIVAFILAELAGLPQKLREALGNPDDDLQRFRRVIRDIQSYLRIKTRISVITGALVWLIHAALGVDYALLWGLLAFALNYIPNIGSILAAVPALLIAFIEHGPPRTGIALAGYLAINMVMGNVIEPRLMGRRLGLSSLVVFLSLVFWGWVWGTVGMFLSVPLTMVVKIWLENSRDLRWLAVLLGPGGETMPQALEPAPRLPGE